MCGLFAIFDLKNKPIDITALYKAVNSIKHRGPDDEGYLLVNTVSGESREFCGDDSQVQKAMPHLQSQTSHNFNLAFGFRRLSIIDLSPAGHQPMPDNEKNIWVMLNGEIYNYIELRQELKSYGYKFKSNTDTEVIMYSYIHWGEECFKKFNGMWAILILDKIKQKMICSRDRFGVKPLYYFYNEKILILASELKAVIAYLKGIQYKNFKINEDAVYDYLIYTFIDHSNETFLRDVFNLPPSTFLRAGRDGSLALKKYFELQINDELGKYDNDEFEKYCSEYRAAITDSIRLRLRTDVPIGSCLSGGLDSSSIVSIINKLILSGENINKEQIGNRQKTFSAIYKDRTIDESEFIREIVRDTNCDAHYIEPGSEELIKELDKFIYHLDEPFVSTSMYAQWNVMKLAGLNGVKVLLDGQGSDETVAGYPVYYTFFYVQLLKKLRVFSFFNEIMRNFTVGTQMIKDGSKYYFRNKFKKTNAPLSAYEYFNPHFVNEHTGRNVLSFKTTSNLQIRLLEDTVKFSLPMLLRFEDRNSMAFSIEARTPFLDYRLVQFLMKLPVVYKMKNGWTKWILRNALKEDVRGKILWRKDKKGFPTPEVVWLKDLKKEIIGTMEDSKDYLNGYVNVNNITREFDSILMNKNIKTHFLWRVYNLAKWKKIFGL